MKIAITGASGFVGKALSRCLLDQGHEVVGLGTSPTHPLESVAVHGAGIGRRTL